MIGTFLILLFVSILMSKYNDTEQEKEREGEIKASTMIESNFLNSIFGWIIVIFNKFVIGKAIHMITDIEKISSSTHFNVSFGIKLSICLFLNTAIISYIIDIVLF